MKKLLLSLVLIFWLLASPSVGFSITQKSYTLCAEMSATLEYVGRNMLKLVIDVDSTGAITDGVFPNALVSELTKDGPWYFLFGVAHPESGGTGPTDGSDIFILNEFDQDILGSEDCVYGSGCSTAYNGLNAIDNTSTTVLYPDIYIMRAGEHIPCPGTIPVSGAWTIDIDNNVANADITITLYFVR